MDSYSYISNSTSREYSYSSTHHELPYNQYDEQQEIMSCRKPQPPAHRAAIHSVRKFPTKKFITKKLPIAPFPRTPPKLYKVDPADFKDAVQRLTGVLPKLRRITWLQEVAPPPLSLPRPPALFHPWLSSSGNWDEAIIIEENEEQKSFENICGALSPLGFTLSPSSVAWCSSILMSPGTLASCFDPSALL